MNPYSKDADFTSVTGQVTPATAFDTNEDAKFAPGGFQAEPSESVAFGSSKVHATTTVATDPTPLPKRPKGRLAVGAILLLICILIGQGVWSTFFRFTAYGILIGDVAEIAAPWDGVVTGTYGGESEPCEQSDLLATLDSLPIRHRLDRLGDQLRIAQAELDAQISRLRWAAQDYVDLSTRAVAQHHEAQGELAQQCAFLDQLQLNRDRVEALIETRAVSTETRDAAVYEELGQRGKVSELKSSAAFWKSRAELVCALHDEGFDQLAPQLATIENLQKEIVRLRETLAQGLLRAPFDSVVATQHKLTGESVKALEPVVQVLQSGSLEAVLYLKQHDCDRLQIGDNVHVWIEPQSDKVPCEVIRIGSQLEKAPGVIERFYWSNEPLLPVYLEPSATYRNWLSLRIGSVVKW